MKFVRPLRSVLVSRVTSPAIIGIFLLVYIALAFFTEDALTALMELTRRNMVLVPLLALLPLNSLGRIVLETGRFVRRRRALAGSGSPTDDLFNESISIPARPLFDGLQEMLLQSGYRTRVTEHALAAWRGRSTFPARLLFLCGLFCLFVGIFISLVSRTSYRGAVVEGVPLPLPSGNGGMVERLRLESSTGPILSREILMEVAPSRPGQPPATFGIYPPALHQGLFVYPRYLGVALLVQLSAPDLPNGYRDHALLNIYPPGKEAALEVPDSPYRLVLTLSDPGDGSDPFVTGRMTFTYRLLKGQEVVLAGTTPGGGEDSRNGYRIRFPDFRRMVITDFVRDYGVPFIWGSLFLLAAALLLWLPLRFLDPRREMLFIRHSSGMIEAASRAEGGERLHAGVFHEALDYLETKSRSNPGGAG